MSWARRPDFNREVSTSSGKSKWAQRGHKLGTAWAQLIKRIFS